jgi:UPF0755 protein
MNKKYIMTVLAVIMIFVYFIAREVYSPQSFTDKAVIFSVPVGTGSSAIARKLYKENVIRQPTIFKLYVKVRGAEKKLKAGNYKLNMSNSLVKILDILLQKEGSTQLTRVTIPEGYDLIGISEELEKKGLVKKEDYYNFVQTKAKKLFLDKYKFLEMVPTSNLEGYLYPDTYFFSYGDTEEVITEQFLKQFQKKMMPVWDAASTLKGTPKARFNFHKVVTMASIIEKEAQVANERPIIASVYYNRLKKLMPLAADPTVVYGLGRSWKKIVTYKDLKVDSPYNTYKHAGFPPTPIASSGVAAFRAALAPAKTNYFFFVANNDGTHSFTRTYREHLNVQKKIRKKLKK